MSYTVIVYAEAQSEYEEAAEWYEEQKAGLGYRFIDVLESKLKFIASNPKNLSFKKERFS